MLKLIQYDLAMNKTFVVEKKGKRLVVLIRQIPGHDPAYKIGSHIPSYGKVIEVRA